MEEQLLDYEQQQKAGNYYFKKGVFQTAVAWVALVVYLLFIAFGIDEWLNGSIFGIFTLSMVLVSSIYSFLGFLNAIKSLIRKEDGLIKTLFLAFASILIFGLFFFTILANINDLINTFN